MQKIIFLGTDLHGKPSELASKIARDMTKKAKNYTIVSIQNIKPISKENNKIIIPRFFKNERLRKIFQGILLPLFLIFLRTKHKKIFCIWTPSSRYHYYLFWLLKVLRYSLEFMVISGYDKNYEALKFCDRIICQSKRMKDYISSLFPEKEITLVYPSVDFEIFKPKKKTYDILIPSVPYKIKDFEERGVDKIIKILKKGKFKTIIIFRSGESYNYFKKLNLKNVKLINKILDDKELAEIMSKAKVIPLIYEKNSPDMPLSAVEGLASGCAILCTENIGLAEIIKKEKCGIVIKNSKNKEIWQVIEEILSNSIYNKNARKAAEKYFRGGKI